MSTPPTFHVGEIAIFARPGSVHYGRECTIVGPLEWRLVRTPSGIVADYCYLIDGDFQRGRACPPQHLRKKHPPPDWVTLCHLHDLPISDLDAERLGERLTELA